MQHDQTNPNPTHDLPNLPTDRRALLAGLGGIAAGAFIASKANAGPLNPPAGPIESTGKTLRDVEPRIAINSTNTPGDTDSVFRISASGSYYLTGNVTASTGKSAIEIAASNVTIDLRGYSITTISNLAAIRLSLSGRTNISIRDGHIGPAGTGGGIDLTPLIGTQTVGGSIENVHVTGTEGTGIQVGDGVVLIGCTASNNGQHGIRTGASCVITDCTAFGNNGVGITTTNGCTHTNCSSSFNDRGFITDSFGTITNCIASNNSATGIFAVRSSTLTSCTASSNGLSGISVGGGCTVTDCVASTNSGSGISCDNCCIIRDNICTSNGDGNNGAGIFVFDIDNRIEGNTCINSYRGIFVEYFGNFIARNTCSGNDTNWSIAAGNVCLVVQAATGGAINGNSGGVSPGSSNPNANYTI
jgi:parallel beta-helix repeat protein